MLAVAVLFAACSSSPSNTASTGSTTSTTATHHTTSSTTANSTTSSTTATETTCQSSGLSFSIGQGNGAAGTIEEPVIMTNTSGSACTLSGYPGMQLYDAAGAIPTNVVRGGVTFGTAAANGPVATVTLAPNGTAQFTLHYSDVPVDNESSCPTSTTAHITPPNDLASATVPLAIAPCGMGTVHVSPVYAG
jgi:hypothetical protein